ncbi:MAG TPA: DUF2179 domain-containing protein [Bacteroidales bacterium]|nr:DUF2179 domain-containing protein [Bacteroidales bacterium]HPR57942.1 DUF2179 domain-containing protein [Bacteroidales bacterium]HRW97289.1 DUF2179 domain-containing protein [Bacteroidales bacterium]
MNIALFDVNSWVFIWIVLPLLIFFSRIADQSIGTLRLIFVSKGYKYIAPLLGFFEVIIWLLAVSQILKQMDNFLYYIAYGAGFAAGNFIGITLEERISLGTVIVRIMPKMDTSELVQHLREKNFGMTLIDAQGSRGPVKIIFLIIPRKQLKELISIINQFNPNAFYSVEEVKSVRHGVMRQEKSVLSNPKMPQFWRKSK